LAPPVSKRSIWSNFFRSTILSLPQPLSAYWD